MTEQELQGVEARLRTINQGAQIRRASRASVDVSFVTGLNMQDTHCVVSEVRPDLHSTARQRMEAASQQRSICSWVCVRQQGPAACLTLGLGCPV